MIRTHCLVIGCWMLASVALLSGCSSRAVSIDNPIPIARTEYDRVFEASVRVLRDYHFVVERQDRRFGIISTRPRAAASALEPWYNDNTTAYQTLDNTLNYDRRIVHVYLEKAGESDQADAEGTSAQQLADASASGGFGSSGSTASGSATSGGGGALVDYQLRVEVQIERRQIPPTNLHTAAVTSVTNYGYQGNANTVLTEQGYESSQWRPLKRDEYFEQRLVAQILAVAGRIQPLHDTAPGSSNTPSSGFSKPVEHVEPGEVPAPPTESAPAAPVPNP